MRLAGRRQIMVATQVSDRGLKSAKLDSGQADNGLAKEDIAPLASSESSLRCQVKRRMHIP